MYVCNITDDRNLYPSQLNFGEGPNRARQTDRPCTGQGMLGKDRKKTYDELTPRYVLVQYIEIRDE